MDHSTPAQHLARLLQALARVLEPSGDLSAESELLHHFPFARTDEEQRSLARLRIPTTAHGSL